jgi:periplasmic divalent cation tolerance protein
MANKTSLVVLYVTASSREEAEKIAANLVETKLAACCNIVQGVNSIYFWDGKVNNDNEALMIIKSRESLIERIASRVKELHSYKVPEVIALPIVGGSSDYIKWVLESTI